MIGEQDDQRLVVDTLLLQIIDELADDRVRISNLAVVMIRITAEVRFGRRVRGVRLVQMQKQKRAGGSN